jgi:non-haem Fe2+, alpha-ketoglutarate-dependent halogenase
MINSLGVIYPSKMRPHWRKYDKPRLREDRMGTISADAVRQFNDQGYFAPIRALTTGEAANLRNRLETFEAANSGLTSGLRDKPHLLFTWLDELVRHPGVLDAVEQVIGPSMLVWGSSFFIKEPRNPSFVSWHQDSTYWGLEPPDIVTAWVALSESTHENGAMRVIPGSHKLDQAPHRDTFAANNLLSRGQEIMVEVDESKAVELPLQPGEMSLHHVRLIHGSDPNPSAKRRIGFAIRYIPTYVRQAAGMRDSATLVRGVDKYCHFEPERRPEFDMAPAAQAHHAEVMARIKQVLMHDSRSAAAT